MLLNNSLKRPWNLSKPIVVRLTALVLLLSLALPVVMFSEWNTAKARTIEKTPRPISAPPEAFLLPREKRGWEQLGDRISMLGSGVLSVLQTQNQSAATEGQSGANDQSGIQDDPEKVSEPNDDSVKRDETAAQFEKQLSDKVREDVQAPNAGPEEREFEEASAPPPPQPAGTVDFNFGTDSKSDVGIWHPQTKTFKVKHSNGGTDLTVIFSSASASAKPAPADYDGDGKTDPAVFDGGTWYINKSSDNNPLTITPVYSFGQAGDIPMSGDYRGNNSDELVVYRPSTGYWYWRELGPTTQYNLQWGGTAGDIAAPGDYDGDGKMDWTVYRASTGYWYILFNNLAGYTSLPWGIAVDIPVQADYDGDGKTDPAIWRPTEGGWWYLKSSTSYSTYGTATWGNIGDQPAVGDFDGDSKADFTVFRPSSGKWHTWTSQNAYQGADLGIAGDIAVPSSYVKQIGSQIAPDVINKERLKPRNATGGTDLYSQNFGWSRGLVSLPGRSGMDLNVGLSYNSLIWTKVDSAMLFDTDYQVGMTPGFHVGLPSIEPSYYDDDTDKWNYLMVTPSGAKVEFRQTAGAANVYETYDSSYAQLTTTGATDPNDPVEDITLVVVTTDGTQMFYDWISGAFRCTTIRDRNGNYISVTYDPSDRGILTITDTLGRVVNFNYTDQNLSSITQTWKTNNGKDDNTTHTYATFAYTTKTIAHDFHDSLTVWGPYNGTALKVLDKVTYADGSSTKFHYNGYAQVFKVEEHAADSGGTAHVLNHVRTNIQSPSADQTDVPRFSQVWNKVENFNSGNETTATITRSTGQSYTSPAGGSALTATKIEVAMTGHPHNAISKRWYGESGWKNGLPLATEDWADGTSGSERKRWTLTQYEQDKVADKWGNPITPNYLLNPRVVETKVGDGVNTKRTTIEYLTQWMFESDYHPVLFGLVKSVKVYDTDQTTVLKKSTTEYNLDPNYVSRRIIGLPQSIEVEGYNQLTSSTELVSKVSYGYDEGNFSDSGLQQNISPVQHDSANFGSSFAYRGNLTSTTRWDVTQPRNASASITASTLKYNTAGSVVAKITPWEGTNTRTVKVSYEDAVMYNDDQTNRNTSAYPTKIFDPAGNYSQVKYRFDIGANVRAESPPPAGKTQGKITEREFDAVGRLMKESLVNNGAYTRYEYPANGVHTKVFSTLADTNNNGIGDSTDEMLTENWQDGAGRVRMSRTPHTFDANGNTLSWAASLLEYDNLGRLQRRSVPMETDANWNPVGEDASRGWLWSTEEYDWMDRLVRTVNSDGTDRQVVYEGCGCAGGQVTTIRGENIVQTDWQGGNPTSLGRRTQRIHEDGLGRRFKTEVLNWDNSVYSTTINHFNGGDQIADVVQTEASTSVTRTTAMTYDGYGRLKTEHTPEQNVGKNNTYDYNTDGSLASITDARGVVTSYTYDNRALLEQISYTLPSPMPPNEPAIAPSSPVSFTFDAAGNQSTRTDGFGTLTFEYDEVSNLTSETRSFNGPNSAPMPYSPLPNNSYRIAYSYDLSGKLKSVTDPFGAGINYQPDKNGRLSSITGNGFAGVGVYIGSIKYRAWGDVDEIDYPANGVHTEFTYNDRLLPETEITSGTNTNFYPSNKRYTYTADGNIRFVDDQLSTFHESDRSFQYDHVGRLTNAATGVWARGESETAETMTQFKYSFTYNAWSDVISENKAVWFEQGQGNVPPTVYTHLNGRLTGSSNGDGTTSASSFDADGRLTTATVSNGSSRQYKYSGDGLLSAVVETNLYQQLRWTEGQGGVVKERFLAYNVETQAYVEQGEKYYLRSSVLGGDILTELNKNGSKSRTFVYGLGTVVAVQQMNEGVSGPVPWVGWEFRDTFNTRFALSSQGWGAIWAFDELDPLGAKVTPQDAGPPEENQDPYWMYPRMGVADDDATGMNCAVDGVLSYCSSAVTLISLGLAIQCPYSSCGPQPVYDAVGRRNVLVPFNAQNYLDGGDGYPLGGRGTAPTLQTRTPEQRAADRAAAAAANPVDLEPDRTSRDIVPPFIGMGDNSIGNSYDEVTREQAINMTNQAYNDAHTMLKNKKCRKAVSSTAYDAVNTLEELSKAGNIRPFETYESSYNAWTPYPRTGLTVGRIDLYKNFFSESLNNDVGTTTSQDLGLDASQRRALTLLHELAHVTRKYGHINWPKFDWTLPGNKVNKKIYEACFKGGAQEAAGTRQK